MITRRQLPVKQNLQSFLHPRKIAENRLKTQKRCKFNLQIGCGLSRQKDLEWRPLLPGCGTQHPHRALGGTRVLLAAAPTTPPCFRRWRRSSLLQRKNYFYFRASGASADAPLALFHGRWFGTNSLSQSLTALPAPSKREPLVYPQALHFSRKPYRHAKGPISEGAVAVGDWGSSLGSA